MRILRLFSILDRLRISRHPISAESLATVLSVSARTIYRDMATLQSMGAPIRGESGIGYQMEKGYFLPPLHFDPDELDALILGMRMVAVQGDEPLADAATRATSKITAALMEEDRDKFSTSPLRVWRECNQAQNNIPWLSVVRKALHKRKRLHITYKDLKNRLTVRTIRPLGLTIFDNVWLLTTWCELRNEFRNFRVDRLQDAKQTESVFPREAGREFADFLKTF